MIITLIGLLLSRRWREQLKTRVHKSRTPGRPGDWIIQGGAEPTDTSRIGILRRRDSLSWLAARGTVEERTPFHMVWMAVVREMFGTVISRFGDITWPARSPDLTVPDFFLRGFLKDRVFQWRIMTIQERKQAIVDEVAAIDGLRRRVYGNFQTRLQQCIDVNGGHLPDVIFRK